MNKTKFDQNGIFASDARLRSIALECLEQERQERACRRAAWFSKWNDSRPQGTFGTWNISDRH